MNTSQDLFKVDFTNVETGRSAYFFVNGIDEILDKIDKPISLGDTKSSLKKEVLKQLITPPTPVAP